MSTYLPGHAPTSRDDSPDEEDGLGGLLEEQFDALYPVTAPPSTGPEYDQWLAQLPSIGSANHFNGSCDRCCFHPKGRCLNGYSCQHCHFDHEKRKRKGKKRSERVPELGSEMGSMPPTPHGPHEAFNPVPVVPAPCVSPAFHEGLEIPPPVPAVPDYPFYPEEMPFHPGHPAHPGSLYPDPTGMLEARDDYVRRLEEENHYLRSMLLQHLGPGASSERVHTFTAFGIAHHHGFKIEN